MLNLTDIQTDRQTDKYFHLGSGQNIDIRANYNITLHKETNERDMELSIGSLRTFGRVPPRQRQCDIKWKLEVAVSL